MLILDTNVLSALMQAEPDPIIANWIDRQPAESVWTTAVSVFEIRYGIYILPAGKKRQRLADSFEIYLEESLEQRVLSIDQLAANTAATLASKRHKLGINIDVQDTLIASIALARRARLVTRNTKHFDDLDLHTVNPWKDGRN